ncbi:MAG: hypothetical protein ACI4SF_11970 [Oscillospiraceae bacterium]
MDNKETKNHEITDEEAAAAVGGFAVGDIAYYNQNNAKVKIIGANRAEKPINTIGIPPMLYWIEFEDGTKMTVYEDALSEQDQTCELFSPSRIAGNRCCDNCELYWESECPRS